jgi:hypothetical protein
MPPKKAVTPSGPAASTRSTRYIDTPSVEGGDQNEQSGAEDTGHLWLPDPGDDADPMTLEQFKEEIKDAKKSYQQLQRLWNIVRAISTTVAEKDAQIEELQDLAALATEMTTRTEVKRSPKQPDPPMLTDGTNPTFEGWKIKMKNKLRENSDHFQTEKSKVGYMYGCTEGDAACYLEPGMENDKFLTPDDVYEFLESIYSDPDRELNAREEYRSLIMGKLEFSEFITKFRHLANRAKIHESNWKDDLFAKITYNMQQSLMPMRSMIGSFDDLVRQCRLLDIGMRNLNERRNRGNRGGRGGHGGQQRGSSHPPNSSSTQSTGSSTPNRLPNTPHLTAEERNKYLKENRCFKCGKTGHLSRVCPDRSKESTNVAIETDDIQVMPEQGKE